MFPILSDEFWEGFWAGFTMAILIATVLFGVMVATGRI